MNDENYGIKQEQPDSLEVLKTKILTTTSERLEALLANSGMFYEGTYPYGKKPNKNILTINGPDGFLFMVYIEDGIDFNTDQKILKPAVFSVELPEKFQGKGWGTKLVKLWEGVLIDCGFKGNTYLKAVQQQSKGFAEKLGYTQTDFDGWVKQI